MLSVQLCLVSRLGLCCDLVRPEIFCFSAMLLFLSGTMARVSLSAALAMSRDRVVMYTVYSEFIGLFCTAAMNITVRLCPFHGSFNELLQPTDGGCDMAIPNSTVYDTTCKICFYSETFWAERSCCSVQLRTCKMHGR